MSAGTRSGSMSRTSSCEVVLDGAPVTYEHVIYELQLSDAQIQLYNIGAVLAYLNESFNKIAEIVIMEVEYDFCIVWHIGLRTLSKFVNSKISTNYLVSHRYASTVVESLTMHHLGLISRPVRFIVKYYHYMGGQIQGMFLDTYKNRSCKVFGIRDDELQRVRLLTKVIAGNPGVVGEIKNELLEWTMSFPHPKMPKYFVDVDNVEGVMTSIAGTLGLDRHLLLVKDDFESNLVSLKTYRAMYIKAHKNPSVFLLTNLRIAIERSMFIVVCAANVEIVRKFKDSLSQALQPTYGHIGRI